MQIDAPFTVSVIDNPESQSRELHLSFTESFQNTILKERIELFTNHIKDLGISAKGESDQQTLDGMNTILQISEQLLPHIVNDEIPLNEDIVIEIGPSSPFDQLISGATLK